MKNIELNLQKWLMENKPDDNMVYKPEFCTRYTFIMNTIIPLFSNYIHTNNNIYDSNYYNDYANYLNSIHSIVGTHISKSIDHPVIKIVYKGVDIVFRYNFYNFEITVKGNTHINMNLINRIQNQSGLFFYEGFPKEYRLDPDIITDKCFSFSVDNSYDFYTFMFLLKNAIDGNL